MKVHRWCAVVLLAGTSALAACGGSPTTQPSSTRSPVPAATRAVSSAGVPPADRPTPGQATQPSPAATEYNPPGDIPDNQAYVAFPVPGSTAIVKVPEGWSRTVAGGTTTFADKLNRIAVAGRSVAGAPTAASLTRDEIPALRSMVPKFAAGPVAADRRAGQPVIVIRYQGDSPQDPVTGKVVRDAFERYVYFHAGRQLELTLSGPVNADNVDPWRIVSDSVRWRS